MEEQVLNLMLNGGANIAFAYFLYTQNKELQKRADEREAKQDAREKELRDRYDTVIKDMQTREVQVRETLVKEINDLDKRMTLLEQKMELIYKIVDEIKARFLRVQ